MTMLEILPLLVGGFITLVVGIILWDFKDKKESLKIKLEGLESISTELEKRLDKVDVTLAKLSNIKESHSELKEELREIKELVTLVRIQLGTKNSES